MGHISFVRYSPETSGHLLTGQLVECFREVFADGPWHEWLKCPKCEKYWGTKDLELLASQSFQHCGVPLVDYWPREKVISDLKSEITPGSSCWLSMDGDKLVGFCWGYPIPLYKLESKLGVPIAPAIGLYPSDSVAYQDEVGVIAPYRGQKLAKAMVALRHEDFLNQGLRIGAVRTRQFPEPSTTFLWYTEKLGYEVASRYSDGRVILTRELSGLRELLTT